jgi:hypothetical protein
MNQNAEEKIQEVLTKKNRWWILKRTSLLCWDDDLLNHSKLFSDSSDLFGIAIDFLVFGIIEEFTERKICENSNPNNFRNSNSKPQITEKKIQFQVHQ